MHPDNPAWGYRVIGISPCSWVLTCGVSHRTLPAFCSDIAAPAHCDQVRPVARRRSSIPRSKPQLTASRAADDGSAVALFVAAVLDASSAHRAMPPSAATHIQEAASSLRITSRCRPAAESDSANQAHWRSGRLYAAGAVDRHIAPSPAARSDRQK